MADGKEYRHKSVGPYELWATYASYFWVVGLGYYYLATVVVDYSWFILAHRFQRDMTADSLILRKFRIQWTPRVCTPSLGT